MSKMGNIVKKLKNHCCSVYIQQFLRESKLGFRGLYEIIYFFPTFFYKIKMRHNTCFFLWFFQAISSLSSPFEELLVVLHEVVASASNKGRIISPVSYKNNHMLKYTRNDLNVEFKICNYL